MTKDKLKYVVDASLFAERDFFSAMPNRLYKYRIWNDHLHQKILRDFEIFFPNPSRFNDPYDCGLPFRQDPNDLEVANIKEALERTAIRKFPNFNKVQIDEECAKQIMLILQAPEEYFQENYGYRPNDLSKMFGVLSLTPHPDNFLMWSHYSNSHKGFVVGFNTKKLVNQAFGKFKPVNYTNEIPFISVIDDKNHSLMDKLIYTKSIAWQYEDEYRITKVLKPDTSSYFTSETLETIYLGFNMPYEQKMEIIAIVQEKFSHCHVFEMKLNSERFKPETQQVL
jgi:hypothetical protein